VGAFLGDNTGYWLGRRLGTRVLERYGRYAFFDREALAHVRTYYASHGGKTVLLGRFTSIIRSFGPFVAGSSHMPYGRFALWSAVGCVAWGTLYSLIGYYFGESWDVIEKYLGRAGLMGFLCGVALLAGYLIVRKRRARRAQRGGDAGPRAEAGGRRRRGGRNRSRGRRAGDAGGPRRRSGRGDR
jgi:undecaprenyl-diphosphatase